MALMAMSGTHSERERRYIRRFVAAVVGLFALCAAAYGITRLFLYKQPSVAKIMTNGVLFAEIPLEDYKGEQRITVPSRYNNGENVVEIKNGRISVLSATCPDKICIHQGERGVGCDNTSPIVCLPNRFSIVIEGAADAADAAAGID